MQSAKHATFKVTSVLVMVRVSLLHCSFPIQLFQRPPLFFSHRQPQPLRHCLHHCSLEWPLLGLCRNMFLCPKSNCWATLTLPGHCHCMGAAPVPLISDVHSHHISRVPDVLHQQILELHRQLRRFRCECDAELSHVCGVALDARLQSVQRFQIL